MPNYLTSVGLAYWIMDDGSYNQHKGNIILCTDCYTKEDVLFLISILKDKFNLSPTLRLCYGALTYIFNIIYIILNIYSL